MIDLFTTGWFHWHLLLLLHSISTSLEAVWYKHVYNGESEALKHTHNLQQAWCWNPAEASESHIRSFLLRAETGVSTRQNQWTFNRSLDSSQFLIKTRQWLQISKEPDFGPVCIKHVCMSLLWSCDTATSLAVSPPCYSRTNCTYSFGTSAGLSGCHHRGERLSSDDGEQEVETPHKESEVEVWRGHGWRRGCWSWSLFFCGALPSDHLHQVDIRRVYSGVCNCILSPVLHCQPWKWNLINPDQFLMYKMNWQGFKKGGATIQIRWMIHSHIFAPTPTLNTHTHNLSPPYHPLLSVGFISLSKAGQA